MFHKMSDASGQSLLYFRRRDPHLFHGSLEADFFTKKGSGAFKRIPISEVLVKDGDVADNFNFNKEKISEIPAGAIKKVNGQTIREGYFPDHLFHSSICSMGSTVGYASLRLYYAIFFAVL